MRTTHLLLTAVLCATSSLACMTSADVEADNIEITCRGLRFDGAPAGTPGSTMATEGGFDLDASSLSWAKDLDGKVRVKQVRLVATEGVQDLGFLELLTATMASASDPREAVSVASYQRSATAVSSVQLEITNPEPIGVANIWAAQQVRVAVMLAGQLPAVPWSVDVTVVLDGEFTVRP